MIFRPGGESSHEPLDASLGRAVSTGAPQHVPSQDGAEEVNGVADRVRREMYRNIGLQDLLSPRIAG